MFNFKRKVKLDVAILITRMGACNVVSKTDPFACLFLGLHSTVFQRREGDMSATFLNTHLVNFGTFNRSSLF